MISPPQIVCPFCGMINCPMEHVVTDDGSVMIMGGIPLDVFVYGVIGVLVLSFIASTWLSANPGKGLRFNLIGNKRVYALVRNRWFQAVPPRLRRPCPSTWICAICRRLPMKCCLPVKPLVKSIANANKPR